MTAETKLSGYLKTPLIFVQEVYDSRDELLEQVSQRALNLGWVREDFLSRIKEREETFPTGIQLQNLGAAIPHTDSECVLKEFVAVVTNERPVVFNSMEDKNVQVKTDIVFILGLNQPHAQLEMLQSLMGLLQNETLLSEMLLASNEVSLLEVIQKNNL
ncbi:PTS sugar transporter subunit IIA [Candidatus Enterococcus ferrettii]|uniref:PTS EIIA type-2 domain-containing protein n=1 Tax=Candidatus Enterococcus ferrettii TaxID=2815324 RepID=A0ABV0EMP1_9ENTE|nr:PTS sugar transporter subunit IIA [Enterococcus sp. 665A]MBO1341570.1 PTS sugar transporter subunit IIA [Enterococcus sp. 665A]